MLFFQCYLRPHIHLIEDNDIFKLMELTFQIKEENDVSLIMWIKNKKEYFCFVNEIHCLFTWNAIVSSAIWDPISPWFKVLLRWNFHIPFFSAQLTVNIPRNIIAKFQLLAMAKTLLFFDYNLQFSPAIDPPCSYDLVTNAWGQVARNFAGNFILSSQTWYMANFLYDSSEFIF